MAKISEVEKGTNGIERCWKFMMFEMADRYRERERERELGLVLLLAETSSKQESNQ